VADKKNDCLVNVWVYFVDTSVVAYSQNPEVRLLEGFSEFVGVFMQLFYALDYLEAILDVQTWIVAT